MPVYRVGYTYLEGGVVKVEADNEQLAKKCLYKELEEYGLDRIGQFSGYDTVHREYSTEEVELEELVAEIEVFGGR